MNFPSAHLQFLATYASYANHPYAPPVCRQARAELAINAEVAPQMNSETFGINERSIDSLTQGDGSLGIRGQSPTESAASTPHNIGPETSQDTGAGVAADPQPGPAAHAEQQRNLPAADPVPAEQSGPGPQSDLFV